MKKMFAILVGSFFTLSAQAAWNNPANSAEEMEIVSQVVSQNPGFDLAKTYVDTSEMPDIDPTQESYLFMDMNQDGGQDLIIILERTICWDEGVAMADCDQWSRGGLDRKLLIYFGQWDGSYKFVGKSANLMMNQGDGGIAAPYGDPLLPLSVEQEDNSLVVDYWGGSSQKWAFTFKIQYRQVPGNGYGFYLIHKKEMWMEWANIGLNEEPDMAIHNISHDLVTGEYVHTRGLLSSELEDEVVESGTYLSPLKRFSQLLPSDIFSWQ